MRSESAWERLLEWIPAAEMHASELAGESHRRHSLEMATLKKKQGFDDLFYDILRYSAMVKRARCILARRQERSPNFQQGRKWIDAKLPTVLG